MMTLDEHLTQIWLEVAELKRRQANTIRHGRITDVDAEKQLVRLRLNPDEEKEEFKSAWIPYAQMAGPDEGKEFKFHNPPAVGQHMTVFAPGGELGQAMAVPFTWHEKAVSPSTKKDEHVMTFGKFTMTIKKDSVVIALGNTKVTWKEDELTFEGPKGQFKMDRLNLEDGANDKVVGDTGSVSNRSSRVYLKTAQPASPTGLDTAP